MIVDIVYIRHGLSCSNAIQEYGNITDKMKLLFYGDPPLTQYSVNNIKGIQNKKVKTSTVDILLSSVLLRAIQTGLHLFPKKKMHVIPYVKEAVIGPTNNIKSIEYQHKMLKSMKNRVDYSYVAKDGKYLSFANKSNHTMFINWLSKELPNLIKMYGLEKRKKIKIAVVTHSFYMKKHLSETKVDKPFNVGMARLRYRYKRKLIKTKDYKITSFRTKDKKNKKDGMIFKGFPRPKEKPKELKNCKFMS